MGSCGGKAIEARDGVSRIDGSHEASSLEDDIESISIGQGKIIAMTKKQTKKVQQHLGGGWLGSGGLAVGGWVVT